MQQRVALARALVFEPSLLLMDEPFGALDDITRRAMRYELLRLWQSGNSASSRKTVLFVTHSIPEAITLSDRVLVLSGSPGTVRTVIDVDLPRPRDEEMETTPAFLDYVVRSTEGLLGKAPIMGICLGHQVLGRAFGASTFKLKFGHRGANHPVRDLATGRIYITAQNHGYAVDADGLRGGAEVSHVNLNDGTVEGLRHRELPVLTIQYHSEASPGPLDNMYLSERFLAMVKEAGRTRLRG